MSEEEYSKKELPTVFDKNARFGILPQYRLTGISTISLLLGSIEGFYSGYTGSSLVYLAENSHRLPKTVGGWYFYHKRKNYVCMKNGMVKSFKMGLKYSVGITGYFGLEAMLDDYRGQTDFLNSMVATTVAAGIYGKVRKFTKFQISSLMKKGVLIGLLSGLIQDLYIYTNGGQVWYYEELGVPTFVDYQDKKVFS